MGLPFAQMMNGSCRESRHLEHTFVLAAWRLTLAHEVHFFVLGG